MGENLNIITQWGELQKAGRNQIFKVQFEGEKKKEGDTIFDLNLVGGKTWRKLWFCQQKTDIWRVKIAHIGNKPDTYAIFTIFCRINSVLLSSKLGSFTYALSLS